MRRRSATESVCEADDNAREENVMDSDLIIGFDGSDAGRDALAFGRRLALATGARTTVLHNRSYTAASDDARDSGIDPTWREAAEQVLDEARDALADVPDVAYQAVAGRSPARALHSAAEVSGAPLIVLGATRRSRFGRIAPGTTADRILHAAPCAVVVAPAGYAERTGEPRLATVGAAVEGGADSDRIARFAAGVARSAGATLRLITVVEHQLAGPLYSPGPYYAALADALRERAAETLERATAAAGGGLVIERRAREGAAAMELIAQSTELDLLVVGSRGYGPVRRVLPGSVGGQVIRDAACPVLVLPRHAPERVDPRVVQLAGALPVLSH